MRILLVEDDAKIASFISKGLKAAGYAVDHASDGEKGLHMVLTEPYDTAIIDIAFENGFNSKSTFNSAFQEITGKTPSEFRKKTRVKP